MEAGDDNFIFHTDTAQDCHGTRTVKLSCKSDTPEHGLPVFQVAFGTTERVVSNIPIVFCLHAFSCGRFTGPGHIESTMRTS
jgi:hypothetical protein